MTRSVMRLLAAIAACLFGLAAANVALAATLSTGHSTESKAQAPAAAPAMTPEQDPGNLAAYRDKVGQTFLFTVTGTTNGTVYGDGIYTDDSELASAAVHAGILSPGETKDVQVQILPGQKSYKGDLNFGVTSSSYGAWDGSYKFLDKPMSEADMVFPDPGKLTDYRGKVGKILQFKVTGSTTESIWGDGVYTDDSDLGTAAVHAGLVKDGEEGTVAVKFMPGQGKYAGKARNGVESQAYGKFDGSYEFVDAKTGEPLKPKG
jgi:hypothetical protein